MKNWLDFSNSKRLFPIAAWTFVRQRCRIAMHVDKRLLVLFPLGIILLGFSIIPTVFPVIRIWPYPAALSRTFSPEVLRWENNIQRWSAGYGLDPNLVATVIQIESCGNPSAESPAGARGLFQVMPDHFSKGEDSFDPETNARRGMEYLATALLRSGGDIGQALAGYNGGHGVIGNIPADWSPETQRYVYWGTGIYEAAKKGKNENPRLFEWLRAGGANLCKQ
jgi:soluble lytic murein transglycosylase-like protein